jgi:hypothetical protein
MLLRHLQIALIAACGLACISCAHVTKPEIVTAQQWGSKPQPIPDSRLQTPKWITIHHAGVEWKGATPPDAFVRNMQAWGQKEKHWPDLPYHFLIAPDGRIFQGRPIRYEPESNTKYDLNGNVGVELMGNFEIQRPSPQQLRSCVQLVAWLCHDLNIDVAHVRGHKDAAPNQTSCPGKDFYRYLQDGEFKRSVTRALHGQRPDVHPGNPLPGGPTTQIVTTISPSTRPATRPAE